MIIGVLADTHIPGRAKKLPQFVLETFQLADHIIHAGDITTMDVIAALEELAPVTAVAGNLDPTDIQERFGEKKIIKLGDYNFGIFHGHGSKSKTGQRALDCFLNDRVDCIIFGHSHQPVCAHEGSILLFNPGSPTDKRRNMYFSFGLIEIDAEIRPRIIYFNANGEEIS